MQVGLMEICTKLKSMKYLFFLLMAISIKSQAGTGSISGVVVDKKNGEPIIGAMIKLSDGKSGAIADLNGTFTIKNIPEGEYEVVISNMSFTEVKEKVTIVSGVNKAINVALESSTVKAKEVTITKKRKQESLTALTVIQKNSAVVADGISSDIIKKSPDRNTGDVIKRVSGASFIRPYSCFCNRQFDDIQNSCTRPQWRLCRRYHTDYYKGHS
jgi:hypothetical protein